MPTGSASRTYRHSSRSRPKLAFSKQQIERLVASGEASGRVDIELDVRDSARRHVTLTRDLRVTASPYVAVLELDRDGYATGDPVSVVARVSDVDSVPLRNQTLELEIEGESSRVVATTDRAGMARFRLRMPTASRLVTLSIPGGAENIAETRIEWQEPVPMRIELASPIVKEREATSVAAFLPAGYSPVEAQVHMDITDTSGAIVGSSLLPVRREAGRFVARGRFVAPSWGSMLLTFFTVGRSDGTKQGTRPLGLLVGGWGGSAQMRRGLPRSV